MKRLLLLSSLAYALLILGLASLNGGVVALSIPIVIHLTAALLFGPDHPRFQITRTMSASRVSEGTPVTIKLLVANMGSPMDEVLIEDLVPQSLEVIEGDLRLLASMGQREIVELEYTVRGKRGFYDFQHAQVTALDRLNLFHRKTMVSAPAQLLILPKITRLKRVPIRPLQTHGYAGPVPSRQGGSGVDFFGVREYQAGDPLRWMNWKLSARHSHTFFTNEFEQDRIADVGLILDARQRSEVRLSNHSLFEHAIHATASLAEAFINDGNRVGLLVYGKFLDWIFPGYGKVQRERILHALARSVPGDSLVFERLDYLPTRFFPARSQIVLISPLFMGDIPLLIRLRARGYQLLVISPDPIRFESQALRQQSHLALATRIAHIERKLLLRKLQRTGIQAVNWQVDKPLEQAVHTYLGRAPHWFRGAGVELRS